MTGQLLVKIKGFFTSEGLKARVLRGGFWLGIGTGFEYGLRFLRNIILARILAPEAFGLMAIILAINGALEAFTQIGVKEAVIQSPVGEERTYLNGAWWLSFTRAIGLFAIAMISVPWLASFYDVSQYTVMFRVSFLTILFNGAMSAGTYIVQKRMDYKKWTIITSGGGAVGIILAIGLSLWLHNVWALVIGYVVEAAARCFLSFLVCPLLPRFQFKQEHSKALLDYARGMFGLPILFFIFTQADVFVVGKLLQKRDLGLYSMALSLAQMPMFLVSTILNPILMPMFSEKQHDKAWINRVLLKSTRIFVLAGTPVACFIALYGKDILTVLYGSQYAAVALPFALMLAATILRAAGTPIVNIYLALGQPRLQRYFTGIRAALMLLLIYPAVKYLGLTGAAGAGLLAMLISYIFQIVRFKELTDLDIRGYGFIFIQAVVVSLPILLVWSVGHQALARPLHNVFLGLIGCITVYGLSAIIALQVKARMDARFARRMP